MNMEEDEINLSKLIRQYAPYSLKKALEEIGEEDKEITIALHPALSLDHSNLPDESKGDYVKNITNFLSYCKEKEIKIFHLRDFLIVPPITNKSNEPSLYNKFGVEEDFQIPTFLDMGVLLESMEEFSQQMAYYGFFNPSPYIPTNRKNNIQVVNAIGMFTDPNASFQDGLKSMVEIASEDVRIIKECTLSRDLGIIDIRDYKNKSGLDLEKISIHSFKDKALSKIGGTVLDYSF